jgi:hypothetical protein
MRAYAALLLALFACAGTAADSESLGESRSTSIGLASKYIGDKGIREDPAVVFAEDFEADSLEAVWSRWESVQNKPIMSLSADVSDASGGTRSLLMTHIGGQGTGGHLYRRLLPGYEKLHVRFYVKFDPDCHPIHHFVHMGGYNPPTAWPQGGAGTRPQGDERFSTGVEPYGNQWRWDFYSYWMGMRSSPDGASWGHDFINDPALAVERGRWICVELMMKMNEPVTESNGEQALWIDGRPWTKDGQVVSHLGRGFPRGRWTWDSFHPDPDGEPFEGFRWRTTRGLNLNFLWLLLYVTKSPEGHVSRVWFDDIVVARDYIGPINRAGGPSRDRPTAAPPESGSSPARDPAGSGDERISSRTSSAAAESARASSRRAFLHWPRIKSHNRMVDGVFWRPFKSY